MGFRGSGVNVGFRLSVLGLRVEGVGLAWSRKGKRVWGLEFRVSGFGFGVEG